MRVTKHTPMSRIKNLQLHLGEKLVKALDSLLIDDPEDKDDITMVKRGGSQLTGSGLL